MVDISDVYPRAGTKAPCYNMTDIDAQVTC
jgi:hypothetical protein